MAPHMQGPLHYERTGRSGPVMVFIHLNPMDQSSWLYQTAHFSTWFRCVAVDLPGYGRSPSSEPGLTVTDLAQACWEAVDEVEATDPVILVGASIGSNIAAYMYHQRPGRTAAVVLGEGAYTPGRQTIAERRINGFREDGFGYRERYMFENFSPAFRAGELARYFNEVFAERNHRIDVESVVRNFEALRERDPQIAFGIGCPVLIITGTEHSGHERSLALKAHLPHADLELVHGAGHACHLEQPHRYDRAILAFLERHGLLPASEE